MHNPTSSAKPSTPASPFLVPKINSAFDIEITLPGSKSIALRQLAIAALCDGTTQIKGIPECDDSAAMLECLQRLGAQVTKHAEHIAITGPIDLSTRSVTLDARMSGASTRLLLGLAALREGDTQIDGHVSLRARTNQPLLDLLAAQGCVIESVDGCLPVTVRGSMRPQAVLQIDGSLSSQYITALLIAAPRYITDQPQIIEITGDLVSKPYIDITLNEMRKRGVSAQWQSERRLQVEPGAYQAGTVSVEGDATAATYFAALATLHSSRVTLTNLGVESRQGDYEFLKVMEKLGTSVQRAATTTQIIGPARISELARVDMQAMPDAALTLIAMAPLLTASIHITGLSSLHHKECDRLECPAHELTVMGAHLTTGHDSIRINPVAIHTLQPHVLTTYHDHRMAMAFSLIGSVTGTLSIDDKQVVNKTYPAFWKDYNRLTLSA